MSRVGNPSGRTGAMALNTLMGCGSMPRETWRPRNRTAPARVRILVLTAAQRTRRPEEVRGHPTYTDPGGQADSPLTHLVLGQTRTGSLSAKGASDASGVGHADRKDHAGVWRD